MKKYLILFTIILSLFLVTPSAFPQQNPGGHNGNSILVNNTGAGGSSFTSLLDVTITSPVDGHTLRYNGTNWVNTSNLFNDGTNIGIGITPAVPLHVYSEVSSGTGITTIIQLLSDTGSGTITGQDALTIRAGNQAGFTGTNNLSKGINIRIDNDGGTLIDARAIHIAQSNGTIGTSYGIYQAGGSDQNYFAGNVGFGTTSFGADFAGGGAAFGNITVAPTGVLTDGVMMWADDFGVGDSRLYIMGEASTDLVIIGSGEIILQPTKKVYLDGGDNTYIYESEPDTMRFAVGGANTIVIESGRLRGSASNTGALLNESSSATNPVHSFRSNLTYGLGGAPASGFISLISDSVEGIRVTESAGLITSRLSDKTGFSNTAEGNIGSLNIQTTREVHTLAAAGTSDTTTISVPNGAVILGAQFTVNTAVSDDGGDDTWTAAFVTGDTSNLTPAGAAAAQNTKINTVLVPVKTTAITQIRFTANGGSFDAGVIEIIVHYIDYTDMDDV